MFMEMLPKAKAALPPSLACSLAHPGDRRRASERAKRRRRAFINGSTSSRRLPATCLACRAVFLLLPSLGAALGRRTDGVIYNFAR